MKILAISDSYPIHPRLKKVSRYFGRKEATTFLLWNRGESEIQGDIGEIVFNLPSVLGNKWGKALKLIQFRKTVKAHLNLMDYEVVICRHWQQLFLLLSISSKKKYDIIYDVCDMPNKKWIRYIESRLVKKTNVVVLASRFFFIDYTTKTKNLIVLENRPWENVNNSGLTFLEVNEEKLNLVKHLTFLGRIRYGEILIRLIECVQKNSEIVLNFYGTGPDEQKLIHFVNQNKIKNVFFYGEYIEKDIPSIYQKSDYIWAAYDNHLFNVKKAISNKFFETLTYQTPGIFAEDTELGALIDIQGIGLIVNPYSAESIEHCLKKIKNQSVSNEIKEKQKNWSEPLYFDNYLGESPYLKINEM